MGQTRAVSAPRERLIIKERAVVREPPRQSFDREREEQYEEEEEYGGRNRYRHHDKDD
jgi:hypothetical protein